MAAKVRDSRSVAGRRHDTVAVYEMPMVRQHLVLEIDGSIDPFDGLAFSPVADDELVVGSENGRVTVFDVLRGMTLKSFVPSRGAVLSVRFVPSQNALCVYTANSGGTSMWDIQTPTPTRLAWEPRSIEWRGNDRCSWTGYSGDGRYLAQSRDESVTVSDAGGGHQLVSRRFGAYVGHSKMSDDGSIVGVKLSGDTVALWDWRRDEILAHVALTAEISGYEFVGTTLITTSHDGRIVTWDLPGISWDGVRRFEAVGWLATAPRGDVIAAEADFVMSAWSSSSGARVLEERINSKFKSNEGELSDDGSILAVAAGPRALVFRLPRARFRLV